MSRFQVRFTNSAGQQEHQSGGEQETLALLDRLPKLGAATISVLAPHGAVWTSEETKLQLTGA